MRVERRISGRLALIMAFISLFFIAHDPAAKASHSSDGIFIVPSNGNDGINGAILVFGLDGTFQSVIYASNGSGQVQGLTFGYDGHIYASLFDSSNNTNGRIVKVNLNNGSHEVFVFPNQLLGSPLGLTFGPSGDLFVGMNNGDVRRFEGTSGASLGVFASGVANPQDVAFGPDGNLYVTSGSGDYVARFDGVTAGSLGQFVVPGSGGLDGPIGLAFGNDGDLFVASAFRHSVFRFDGTTGAFISEFAELDASNDTPTDVAFGPVGDLYANVSIAAGFEPVIATSIEPPSTVVVATAIRA